MKFMTGKDYPHVCADCRAAIDSVASLYFEGEMSDTDDPEAPCMFVYDHRMYCGGSECKNRPNDNESIIEVGDTVIAHQKSKLMHRIVLCDRPHQNPGEWVLKGEPATVEGWKVNIEGQIIGRPTT